MKGGGPSVVMRRRLTGFYRRSNERFELIKLPSNQRFTVNPTCFPLSNISKRNIIHPYATIYKHLFFQYFFVIRQSSIPLRFSRSAWIQWLYAKITITTTRKCTYHSNPFTYPLSRFPFHPSIYGVSDKSN